MEIQKKQSGIGIASLVLGIIGMLTVCLVFGIVPCVIGLVFAIIAICDKGKKKGIPIAGMVCCLLGIVFFVLILFGVINDDTQTTDTDNIIESSEHEETIEQEDTIDKEQETAFEILPEETIALETMEEQETTEVLEETVSSQETEEEYKETCKEYKYKDVLRNPQDYVGERIKITVKISSVHEESWLNEYKYYFTYSNDEYDWWLGDQYIVFDRREEQSPKLLEDDIITVYGEIADPEYTTSLIVSSSELFAIDMKYIDFISE